MVNKYIGIGRCCFLPEL